MDTNTILITVIPDKEGGYEKQIRIDPGMKAEHVFTAIELTQMELIERVVKALRSKGFVIHSHEDVGNFISSMTIGELFNG